MQGPSRVNPSQMEIGDTFKIKNIMFGTEFEATLREASPEDGLTFNHLGGLQSTVISFMDTHDYEFYPTGDTIVRIAKIDASTETTEQELPKAESAAVVDTPEDTEPEIISEFININDIVEGDVIRIYQHNGKETVGINKKNTIDDDVHIQTEVGIHRYIPRLHIKKIHKLTIAETEQESEESRILIGDINYLREQDTVEVHENGQLYEGVVDSISMHTLCLHTSSNVYIYFDSSDDNIEVYLVGDDSTMGPHETNAEAASIPEETTTGTSGTKEDIRIGDVVEVWHDGTSTPSSGVVGLNTIDDDLRLDTETGVRYMDWSRIQKVVVQSTALTGSVTDASVEFFELFEKYCQLPAASVKLAEVLHSEMQRLATTVDLIKALDFAVSTRNKIVSDAIAGADTKISKAKSKTKHAPKQKEPADHKVHETEGQ